MIVKRVTRNGNGTFVGVGQKSCKLLHISVRVVRQRWVPEPKGHGENSASGAGQAVNLGGHDEVAFGEGVDFVGPEGDFGLSPFQNEVWMMALLFGERPDKKPLKLVGSKTVGAGIALLTYEPA